MDYFESEKEEHLKNSVPLDHLLAEGRQLVENFRGNIVKSNLYHYLNTYHDPAHFNDFIGRCRENIEAELEGTSDDLDARLIKQSQSLDCLYDYFVLRSQTMSDLGEEEKEFRHLNMALKAQSQSMRTIEKLRKLREKTLQNRGTKRRDEERKEENDRLD